MSVRLGIGPMRYTRFSSRRSEIEEARKARCRGASLGLRRGPRPRARWSLDQNSAGREGLRSPKRWMTLRGSTGMIRAARRLEPDARVSLTWPVMDDVTGKGMIGGGIKSMASLDDDIRWRMETRKVIRRCCGRYCAAPARPKNQPASAFHHRGFGVMRKADSLPQPQIVGHENPHQAGCRRPEKTVGRAEAQQGKRG